VSLASREFAGLMAAQFLGAFNDNAFKTLVLVSLNHSGGKQSIELIAAASAVFVLPYVLFPSVAGFLADRFSKRLILLWTKVAEVLVLIGAAVAMPLAPGAGWVALAALFLLGIHSTCFSPAKYGILPEMLAPADLARGNGLLELGTFVAIVVGTAAGGLLLGTVGEARHWACIVFALLATLGTGCAFGVARVPAAAPDRRLTLNAFAEGWANARPIRQSRTLGLTVAGIAYFWFLGMLLNLTVLVYAERLLKLGDTGTSLLLAAVALGIGTGCGLAALLSRGRVELGLVPLGAIGLSVFSIALSQSYESAGWTATWLALLGASGGFFVVPLNALLQQRSPRAQVGAVIATSNFVAFTAMLLATGGFVLLARTVDLDPAQIFLVVGIGTLAATAYCCWLLPEFLFGFLFFLGVHTFYRMRVRGREHVPDTGPALLISNHISFVDGFLVHAALPRRARFVVWSGIANLPGLRQISQILGIIPISATDGPRALAASLRAARDALRHGELVCIFAEGQISRTGNLLKFQRGFKKILEGVDAPIVPVYLDRVWGSVFSFEGRKFFWKWPKQIPYPVTVSFGKPLPASAEVWEVRQAVQELGAQSVIAGRDTELPLHRLFIRAAHQHRRRLCMADSSGTELTYGKALMRAIILSRMLQRRLGPEPMAGVVLPPSVGGVLANLALLFAGKTPVNLNFTASKESVANAVAQCDIRAIFSSKLMLRKLKLELPLEPTLLEDLRDEVRFSDKLMGVLAAYVLPAWLVERMLGIHKHTIHDLVTIIFSSGSTGEPKGVMLTHLNVRSNCESVIQVVHPSPNDRLMGILPLFHSFGFIADIWVPIMIGAAALYHPSPLEPKEIGELCAKYGGTILLATPTFLRSYTRRIPAEHFKTLWLVVTGAEKLPRAVADAFKAKFNIEPMEGYGCTELSPVASINIHDFEGADGRQIGNKPGTVGHPIPGVAAQVLDPENGARLAPGQNGMLLIKGPNVMKGYLHKPELTAQVVRDGWYVTGDIANLDDDGFVTITDRLSRFSKIAGEMVPHLRVEEAIHTVLGGEDTIAAVVGVPDASKGEKLVVLHKALALSTEDLWKQLNHSGLPKLWIPARDAFVEVPELPLLGSGKLDLRKLKQTALEHVRPEV
jgi:acyl-[acyl-carrier-protein]-phospholipid O-acyltransferase/long-chain-fatty-acid--[acyl-carrier-protein] ligase